MSERFYAEVWITAAEAADWLGVKPATWRSLVARGYAPPADDPGDLSVPANRRCPRWLASTIRRHIAERPGKGFRSDLGPEGRRAG